MNLWTVGCADSRLTAKTRSPVDKPGKTKRVFPGLPTGRRLPTSFTAPQPPEGLILNLFPGIMMTTNRVPALAYSPPEPVQPTGTTAMVGSAHHALRILVQYVYVIRCDRHCTVSLSVSRPQ